MGDLIIDKMNPKKFCDFGLYFITDGTLTKKSVIDDVKSAVKGGVKIIQYREKVASSKKMIEEASQIMEICSRNNVIFLVNDRIDVAIAVGADGVHLGKNDMPYEYARKMLGNGKIIGLSAESFEAALQNEKIGADYTGIGPIYPTTTKKDAKSAIGLSVITKLKNELKMPFVAIGGINESNVEEVMKAGARNVAMISGIVTKSNVEETVRMIVSRIDSSGKNK